MAGGTSDKSIKEKLDEFLHQKNYFTDGLAFVETKTGVNRLYLFAGKFDFKVRLFVSHVFLRYVCICVISFIVCLNQTTRSVIGRTLAT